MFETEIIDSRRDQKRESFFFKIYRLFDTGVSTIGLLLLAGLLIYFFRLIPALAYGIVLMALLLFFVIFLFIQFSKSKRLDLGKLTLSDQQLNITIKGKFFSFQIDQLSAITVYKLTNSDSPEVDELAKSFYGNNWITFTINNSFHKYEIAIDSNYKSDRLDKLAAVLQSKYKQFKFVTSPENYLE